MRLFDAQQAVVNEATCGDEAALRAEVQRLRAELAGLRAGAPQVRPDLAAAAPLLPPPCPHAMISFVESLAC
jgi:hypothetical protein